MANISPASTVLMERARSLPPQVRFAAVGLLAMSAIIASAAMLRGNETLDALDRAAKPRSPKAVVSTRLNAQAASSAGAKSAPLAPSHASTSASSGPAPQEAQSSAKTAEPSTSAEIVPESMRAPSADLTAARAKGVAALELLAKSYPSDPDVLKALLVMYARQRNQLGAMNAAERLFDASPRAADESEVQQVIMIVANGTPDASVEALRLMSTKMGSRGPDLLYDLIVAPKIGKLPKDRATDRLRDPAVRARATPALLVAIDLRGAMPCARKALYARAREFGDARALAYLKPLTATEGCGLFPLRKSDCHPCLEPRKELHDTIAAIQKRLEEGTPPN